MVSQLRRPRNLSIQINGFPYAPGDTGGGAPTFTYDQELRAGGLDLLPSFREDVAPLDYFAALTPDLHTVTNPIQTYACIRTSAEYTPNGVLRVNDILNISDIGVLRYAPGLPGSAFAAMQLTNSLLGLYSATTFGTLKYYVVPDATLGSYWTNVHTTFAYPTADFMDTLRGITAGNALEIVPFNNMDGHPATDENRYTVSGFRVEGHGHDTGCRAERRNPVVRRASHRGLAEPAADPGAVRRQRQHDHREC